MDKQAAKLNSCLFEATSKYTLRSFDALHPNPLTIQKILAFDRWNRQTANIVMIKFGCFVGIFVSTFLTFRFGVWRQKFFIFFYFFDVIQLDVAFFLPYFFSSLLNEVHHVNEVDLFSSFPFIWALLSCIYYYSYFHCCLFLNYFGWISGGGLQYAILLSLAFTFWPFCSFFAVHYFRPLHFMSNFKRNQTSRRNDKNLV